VEFAIVLPVCLLFLLGIYEYGRFIMVRQLVANAAREGARFAVVHTYDKTTADVQDVVDQRLGGQGAQLPGYDKSTSILVYKADPATGNPLDANNNVVSPSQAPFNNAGFGQAVAVQVTGNYQPVLPFLVDYKGGQLTILSAVPVQATCIMYSEAN
jgi:Flp pilus assembly protein TadG